MNNKLIRAAERAHYIMQLSSYFTELTDGLGVRFAYTRRLSDAWYNQAYDFCCETDDFDSTLNRLEEYFSSRNRLPSIYLTPASSPTQVKDLLKKRDYDSFDEEAWMFYDFDQPPLINSSKNIKVINVHNDEKLVIFSDIYRRGLPGPEVERYIDSVIEGLKNTPPLVTILYYLAYYKGEPAGMASLLMHGDFAGVYAVATVPEFQRKGCARALTAKLIETARSTGSKHIFLQTGSGDESEETFNKLGFKTEFVREGYTTKDAIASMEHG